MFEAKPFREAELEAHGGIQQEFGEVLTILPMAVSPNLSPRRDQSRHPWNVMGVFSWESTDLRVGLEEMKVSTRDPHVLVRKADMILPLKRGDLMKRCETGEVFEVKETLPDTMSGVVVRLVQMGVSPQ